jgi:hypothetical protein
MPHQKIIAVFHNEHNADQVKQLELCKNYVQKNKISN